MTISFTIGHVTRVETHADVKQAFACEGIAGVIFPYEKKLLVPSSPLHKTWVKSLRPSIYVPDGNIRHDEISFEGFTGDREWVRPYLEAAYDLLDMADSFNRHSGYRYCKFLSNNALNEFAHIDEAARNIWLHWHIAGEGMKIYVPSGSEVVSMSYDEEFSKYDDCPSPQVLGEAIRDGVITSFNLKPHEAIAFNNMLLHESATGDRFRCFIS